MKKIFIAISLFLPAVSALADEKLTLLSQVAVDKHNEEHDVKLRPLSELFDRLDIDGNGQLSLDEFETIAQNK